MSIIDEIEKVDEILAKVGNVLIIVGIIDIGIFVYCIMNKYSYSSNLGPFAIIAGIYLRRGSLKAARIASFFSGFYLTILLFVPLLFVSIYYTDTSEFENISKISTYELLAGFIFYILITFLYFWVYKTLTQEIVIASMIKYKKITRFYQHPRTGIYLGLFLILIVTIMFNTIPPIEEEEPQQLSSQLLNP